MSNSIEKLLTHFAPISLSAIQAVALLKRTESKFLTSKESLSGLLETLSDEYSVLEIDGRNVMNYETLYFDTPEKLFYHDHLRGKAYRIKIRKRHYVDTNTFFLEIKRKDKKGNTLKDRTPIVSIKKELSIASKEFIKKHDLRNLELSPSLITKFKRVTLIKKADTERVTIDFDLKCSGNEKSKEFDDIAIIEIKQKRFNRTSTLVKILKSRAVYPQSISKYILGMVSLYPDLKYNNFKETLLQINKLSA